MKTNKYMLSLALTVFLIVILGVTTISATTTLTSPTASSTVSGNVTFNITIAEDCHYDLANFSIYAMSSSTANSSWSLLGTNASVNFTDENSTLRFINFSDLPNMIEDAEDYIFNVTLWNESVSAGADGFLSDDTNTGITVDTTVPQAGTILTPTDNSKDEDGTFVFNVSVVDSNTTGCTLKFDGINPGTSTYTMTHLGEACYYSATDLPEQTYNWYVTASDGTNTTDSSTWTVGIDSGVGSGRKALASGADVSRTLSVGLSEEVWGVPFWVIVLIVGGIVAVILVNRKK